ncbi:hypothetical protein DFJ74DRAFT_694869 [Hyaloraphidium curvatum]|nr:hypothetical protein DFJ74DRAFT_694869 [Hyaloraphidium curvatum]
MISLPNDRNLPLSFTITVLVRMYADTTMSFTEGTVGRRRGRRLLYRDFEVQEIDRAPAVHDAELVTRPVKIRVPENVQVSTDGTVTVLNVSSQTLSPGAIAGIAVVGTALAAALVAAGVLLGRRSRRRSSQIKADAEAAGASADEILAAAKIPKTHSAHIVA